jgi:tRNA-dihydrouridine synthase B
MSNFSWKDSKKPLFILAPMANITTLPFRSICKEMGADVVFTPMLSSNAIIHNESKTLKIGEFLLSEQPLIVQIFGYSGKLIGDAANIVEKKLKPAGIDINLGCPAPKITGNECGSALLKDLVKAKDILKEVRQTFDGQLSVKLRLGWNELAIEEFAHELEDIRINAISIHGRTSKQGYRGESDWSPIYKIASEISIPVIGNGDINDWKMAHERLEGEKLAGVMIGRASLNRPWIFKEIKEQRTIDFSKNEIANLLEKQTKLAIEYSDSESIAINEMKKFYGWYLKGFAGAHSLRVEAMSAENFEDYKIVLKKLEKL